MCTLDFEKSPIRFVLSSILVNATSCVKLYQFAKVFWDYDKPAYEETCDLDASPPPKLDPPSTSARTNHVTTEQGEQRFNQVNTCVRVFVRSLRIYCVFSAVTEHWRNLLQPLTADASQQTRPAQQSGSHRSDSIPQHCPRRRPLTSVQNAQQPVNQSLTSRFPHLERNRATGRNTM